MIETGRPTPLGASWDGDGVNFALFSEGAESIELCLFDDDGRETGRFALPAQADGVWHGYLPGIAPGQAYGYRAHGRYAPDQGLRFNASKLLLDPYARALRGELDWSPAVFDFSRDAGHRGMQRNDADSASCVPKCVVTGGAPAPSQARPAIPWSETIIYELNLRGFTMCHPELDQTDKGLCRGLRNARILEYLKALGITSVELMPVHAFIDEHALMRRGLHNYWGYNSIAFFAPAPRYLGSDDIHAFREMVDAIHDAGLEVILDVAYNHTGESDRLGPTLSFRGIDNLSYYRTRRENRGEYVNWTGCGNTINVDHAVVRQLIIDSLRYWAHDMGVDGFRFDLAPVLGRTADGFTNRHPLLRAIASDRRLRDLKLIAEPWDLGPDGYQAGNFDKPWAEWNGRYRDSLRRFWRGDAGEAGEFARRLHGSADLFDRRGPAASINLAACHDGFTLKDLVTYERRHNEANGEGNRDGHEHNYSANYGIEGETDDDAINALRRQQRLNLLATLLFSQGTPMLLAGDEFGNSQGGNNNAYAQDNATGWLDWSGLDIDPSFTQCVRDLIRLRKKIPLFSQPSYLHGQAVRGSPWPDIQWLRPDGTLMRDEDWPAAAALGVVLTADGAPADRIHAVALLMNPAARPVEFRLPDAGGGRGWHIAFSSAATGPRTDDAGWRLAPRSLACLTLEG